MSTLNGWHPGERIVHQKLGHDSDPSVMGQFRSIDCDLPGDHGKFHSTRLPFVPITTLDSAGRPWGSILAGEDGKPGFIKSSRYTIISVEAKVWQGDPLLETANTFGNEVSEMLVAGIGIEFPTRRRNKFAGKVTRLEKHDETFSMDWTINEAIGNCPKYINQRDLIPHPNTSPKVTHQKSHLSAKDRLPSSLISFIHDSDTVFFGTTYAASSSDAPKFPSHLGMNQRGGRPGFVRVLPSDGRTIVLPDYSGNRIMTSLGNIEATPLASITIVSFTNGAILYITGSASNLFGDHANAIMPFQQRVTTITVDGYTFVEDALPVRQMPGSEVERSPYSPPVRLLVGDLGERTSLNLRDTGKVQALLKSIVPHSSTIATFIWELAPTIQSTSSANPPAPLHVRICAGQAAVLDFTPFLGQQAYLHMAPLKPTAVNDDRIRTWTISSSDVWGKLQPTTDKAQSFAVTMREKPGGTVTGALFSMVRKLLSVGRNDLLSDMSPLGIMVGFVGISGEFVLPEMVVAVEKGGSVSRVQLGKSLVNTSEVTEKKLFWAAGGIGITPFLAMLNDLVSSSNSDSSSWSIHLALATREPEVMIQLLGEALSQVKPSQSDAGSKMRIKLVVDVFSQTSIPDLPRAGDEEGEDRVKVELRPHRGRMGTAFFDALAKEQGEGVGFVDMDAYVCGPDEFEKMVVDALVALGAERGRIKREGFTY